MFARLGFSVAAHVDPEILIVDEVLSVGDYAFQRRCLAKMREILERGTTVLFVSHNIRAVVELCPRCVMLEAGRVMADGPTEHVIATYTQRAERDEDRPRGAVSITRVAAHDDGGERAHFNSGDTICVSVDMTAHEAARCDSVGFSLRDLEGRTLFVTSSARLGRPPYRFDAGQRIRCDFSIDLNLGQGEYSVTVQIGNREAPHDTMNNALTLYISQPSGAWQGLAACNPRFIGDSGDSMGASVAETALRLARTPAGH
jgi:lipopolysaccharide transport system ATP-binding protein